MRLLLAIVCLVLGSCLAGIKAQPTDKSAQESTQSTGRTVSPETKGQQQPQGPTGPKDTTSGGAPAESPQGQTPPGMQSAPEGSSKTAVDPKPEPAAPNKAAKEPVPKASDKEAKDLGFQQPQATAEAAKKSENPFEKGVLVVPGALTDVDTAPAKFSARTSADDALPIAGYTLRHLTPDQRREIFSTARKEANGKKGPDGDSLATVGALVPMSIALTGLTALPASVSATLPEMRGVMSMMAGDQVILVNPRTRVVIGVLGTP